jgi:hypothetical protein
LIYFLEEDAIAHQHHNIAPRVTTSYSADFDAYQTGKMTAEHFRSELLILILNDIVLVDMITEHVLDSYSNDLVRTFCTVLEKQFTDDHAQSEKAIDFIARWLHLIDDDDIQSLKSCSNKNVWLLTHVYTSFEYAQNDILSLYSACRITNRLDPTQPFHTDLYDENKSIRSRVREELFRCMFDHLWKNLLNICSNNDESSEIWIESYVFISKYYPSDKVLEQIQLTGIKRELELMNLAYLIFLNEKITHPKELISRLLSRIDSKNSERNINYDTSPFLNILPKIIETIHQYFTDKNENDSTLMIDLQQWIVSTLKQATQSCTEEINYLFKYLNQSSCRWSLPMKQFLFDQLANLSVQLVQKNRLTTIETKKDFSAHFDLFPTIVECVSDETLLQGYRLPYHPLVIDGSNQKERSILIDLFFFHLTGYVNDELINTKLITKLRLSKILPIKSGQLLSAATLVFQQFKDYFILSFTSLLLCNTNMNLEDIKKLMKIVKTVIDQYLSINQPLTLFSHHLQLFLATIVSKRSWPFLLDLLKSDTMQTVNNRWTHSLSHLLESKQLVRPNKSLQLCHQLQFTIDSRSDISSIFPKLHMFYDELQQIIDTCVKNDTSEEQWKPLFDWIQTKLNSDQLEINQIRALLLLNIYYNYYCNNQLALVQSFLDHIDDISESVAEDIRVFRVLLKPEQHMIGYPQADGNEDINYLNKLFKLDCIDDDELPIRHCLVNLMAMILMGGEESFLWTFAFQPSKLTNTFGEYPTRFIHDSSWKKKNNLSFVYSMRNRLWIDNTLHNRDAWSSL